MNKLARRTGQAALLLVLLLVAAAGTAVAVDLWTDDTEVVAPPFDPAFPAPELAGDDPGDDPGDGLGGSLLPVEVDAPASPLGRGTQVLPTEPAAAPADTTPNDQGPADQDAQPAGEQGRTDTLYSFLDWCAERPDQSCPFGIAGTVLFAEDAFVPLRIKIWPEASKATHPDLRCDPASQSGTKVPVVITSNRPLDSLSYKFETAAGELLEEGNGLRTDPSEYAWFENRPQNQPVDPNSFKDGVQTCLSMRTDGTGAFNVSRTQLFDLTVAARALLPPEGEPSEATESISFNGSDSHPSAAPPISFWPDGNYDLQTLVPQHQFDKVNVSLHIGTHDRSICDPGSDWVPQPNTLEAKPGPGPYDPDYTHYTVWDFRLESAADYTICVKQFRNDQPILTEAYTVQTPHAFSYYFETDSTILQDQLAAGSLQVAMAGADSCERGSPTSPLPTDDFYPKDGQWSPHYNGWQVDYTHGLCWTANEAIDSPYITLQALTAPGAVVGGKPRDVGHVYGETRLFVSSFDPPAGCSATPPYESGDCVLDGDLPYWPNTVCGFSTGVFGGDAYSAPQCSEPFLHLNLKVSVLGGPARAEDRAWVIDNLST